MKLSMKTTLMATAAAAMLAMTAPASFADNAGVMQLEAQITDSLGQLEVGKINFKALSYGQIADISTIIDGKDSNSDKKAAIEQVINANKYAAVGAEKSGLVASSAQLRTSVVDGAKGVGVMLDNPGNLTLTQLDQMTAALDAKGSNDETKAALEAIIDAGARDRAMMTHVSDFPKSGELEKIVVADMQALGIKIENPGKLTLEQLSQLSSIADTKDSDADKAAAAKKVLSM